jgi:hypothetical protein
MRAGWGGSPASESRGVALVRRPVSEYAERGADDLCTRMVNAAVQGLGVHLERRVAGAQDGVVTAHRWLRLSARIQPHSLGLFGQPVMNAQVTVALLAFTSILGVTGSPPIAMCLMRRADGSADDEVASVRMVLLTMRWLTA